MPIPCVKGNIDGLSVFQATADQRFALGEDLFLETHLPVRFWVRHAGANVMWSEDQLLQTLMEPPSTLNGNRVFVLFGAAGAGKSEVMRWLLSQVGRSDPTRARFAVRVARTELDPVRITARILDNFNLPGLGVDVLRRWDELQRKPVALANQLVWQALSGLFDTDEEILPLSFRLRPVVEANLRAGFAAMSDPEVVNRPLQLISREQLEHVLSDTVLDIEPIYEHLRARLQGALEQHAHGGVSLVQSLRTISRHVRKHHGMRPLLIIDDLVQSLNVYASDLLDYLITLEEGEWDVVVGLTPAAFEWDRRGRELLLRIRELDTVDDRVVKLDLSDTTGDSSSFLNEESVGAFLSPYIKQYKQAAGFTCSEFCPHWSRCAAMQWGQVPGAALSPLSPALIRRMWRRLPSGKGRARYLLLAARRALELMATLGTDALPELVNLIERDLYVHTGDAHVKALLECYHPGGDEGGGIPEALAVSFGLPAGIGPGVSPLETRQATSPQTGASSPSLTPVQHDPTIDPVRTAVRDWLEGGLPNRELLKPLRNGLCRLLRDVIDPTLLVGSDFAQPNGALRWGAVQDGVTIPIALEGFCDEEGISVPRVIGAVAFDLLAYAEAKGPTRVALIGKLLECPYVPPLLFQAEALRERWRDALEGSLGCDVPQVAFHLYRVALSFGAELPVPESLAHEAARPLLGFEWPEELARPVRMLWEDCFRIREHLYDGHRIAQFQGRWPEARDSLRSLESVLDQTVSDTFRLADLPIGRVLAAFKSHVGRIRAALNSSGDHYSEIDAIVDVCERLLDGRRRAAIQRRWHTLSGAAKGLLIVPSVPQLPDPEEVRIAVESIQKVKASMGKDDAATRYRKLEALERLRSLSWVRHVTHWHEQLIGVYLQAQALYGRSGEGRVDPSAPRSVMDMLSHTAAFLSEGTRRAAEAMRIETLRDLTDSDEGRFAHRLANLLLLVVPQQFELANSHSRPRQECEDFLSTWSTVVKWLSQNTSGSPPAPFDAPTAGTLAGWQKTIRMACAWWAAYAKQLPLVTRLDLSSELARVGTFLAMVTAFCLPTEEEVLAWHRFLAHAHRTGLSNLPVYAVINRPDMPLGLKRWLNVLVAAEARGVSLAELEPQVLSELQRQLPEWTHSIRVSVIPEGDSDGVLCFLDGQRPGVSGV